MKLVNCLLILLVLFFGVAQTHSYAACSIRTLKNVCDICEEKALSKLDTDSVCPACPEVNCPTASLACIQTDSFQALLKQSYTLVGMLGEDQKDIIFKLNIAKDETSPTTFTYDVRYRNFQIAMKDSIGFLIYDVVNFNLPYETTDALYSFNCIGGIDVHSVLKGACSTIFKDDSKNLQPYRFNFIATPDTIPLE